MKSVTMTSTLPACKAIAAEFLPTTPVTSRSMPCFRSRPRRLIVSSSQFTVPNFRTPTFTTLRPSLVWPNALAAPALPTRINAQMVDAMIKKYCVLPILSPPSSHYCRSTAI